MTKRNARAFISHLKQDEALQNRLERVREGNWESIVRIAGELGFEFTEDHLKSVVPLGFYKGHGQAKDLGWSLKTRKK